MPVSSLKELEKRQKKLFVGMGSKGQKIAWISWDRICESREDGGLGVRDLRSFNIALLSKCIWRLKLDNGVLWKEIMESKYGGWRGLKSLITSYKESL